MLKRQVHTEKAVVLKNTEYKNHMKGGKYNEETGTYLIDFDLRFTIYS